jgi:putative addiction module component (TIGR02574 family)
MRTKRQGQLPTGALGNLGYPDRQSARYNHHGLTTLLIVSEGWTMNISTTLTEIRSMSIDDRIRLVQAIWDLIAVDQGHDPLSDAQTAEIDRRLADDDANPDDVIPWGTIKAEAKARSQ